LSNQGLDCLRDEADMHEYPDGLAALVVALNTSLVDEESLDATLSRVAFIACQAMIGADHAGVTLQRAGGPLTVAYHGDVALPLDHAQYDAGDGPCLRAYRTGGIVQVERIADFAAHWPAFTKAAADNGVVSSLSMPLAVKSDVVGALNLYATQPMDFTDENVHLAVLFAEQAALAVTNAEVYFRTFELTQNLTRALENREVIGQAKGILATRFGVTMDEAFERLRTASQNQNIKVRDLADHVVRTGELPSTPS
jgi:GAF domain-containing protein